MRDYCSMLRFLLVLGLGLGASTPTLAKVKLPALFSDHMVLQATKPIAVWGWADKGEKVEVAFNDHSRTTTAGDNGKWSVRLDPQPASNTPTTFTVKGENTITIKDVLVGEVWLCSGQSNMAWTVQRSLNPQSEAENAKHPGIRMFFVRSLVARTPQEDCQGSWVVCTPETVSGFSATGYFFGRHLHETLKLPVGLINSSVGGTPIEAWTSETDQQGKAELAPILNRWKTMVENYDPQKAQENYERQLAARKSGAPTKAKAKAPGKKAPAKPSNPRDATHHPGNLYNAKIAPLAPFTLRGAIWYQGESNAGNAKVYGLQLRTMIANWRAIWAQDEFAFAWVQLPNFKAAQTKPVQEETWPILREQMADTLAVPHTGMAITIDIGEANDIHPKNKQDVGKRLALWALTKVYGKEGVYSGPLYASHAIKGNEVIISFQHAEGGLECKANEVKGFAIAGADKKWHWANAKMDGDKVVVSHPDVSEPKAVRYAWADNPVISIYNRAGLPAAPFRTDR